MQLFLLIFLAIVSVFGEELKPVSAEFTKINYLHLKFEKNIYLFVNKILEFLVQWFVFGKCCTQMPRRIWWNFGYGKMNLNNLFLINLFSMFFCFVLTADVYDFIYLRPAANENMKCFRACVLNECYSVSNLKFKKKSTFIKRFWKKNLKNPRSSKGFEKIFLKMSLFLKVFEFFF